ncbi:YSC84-related protein [Octadecabacter sp. 1_MG-2023]|uniref:lipid-binding SYLF domain-containing protein n=1 Tax=unclassified Octadecabacter TaxID=196158 RepID=UPI001C085194|nr:MULTISPECIES: YSC84-related protein [unclassified Octadecabacter]MBU2993245.1 twin-arginine translocation pathway signal [Octadecabacter sp. B2R22]MDO6733300.1 YSC84-related protein [Octadecabacter sp. 1_MG-2023]
MTLLTRRSFALSALATTTLSACGNGIGGNGADVIDSRVDSTINFMYDSYPGTRDLANKASGMLVMPVVTEAGLGLGGSYGRGALRIGQTTVDYYSSAAASAGLQIGAQQFSTVLFFMTEEALTDFRRANGWAAGADIEYALRDDGQTLRAETTTSLSPVIAVVFAQAGFRAGATIEGTKYTRIIP